MRHIQPYRRRERPALQHSRGGPNSRYGHRYKDRTVENILVFQNLGMLPSAGDSETRKRMKENGRRMEAGHKCILYRRAT